MKLKVAEHFTSLQGESTYAGKPCFFIRLAGCNLNCSYCDTIFAKDAKNGNDFSIDQLIDLSKQSRVSLVEITGGEPLLQNGAIELMENLIDNKFKVLLETNGSISLSSVPKQVVKILDCKTPSSGEANSMDFIQQKHNTTINFSLLSKHDEIKFVISTKEDYLYAKQIIDKFELNKVVDNILFSPVEIGNSENKTLLADIAEWILNDRLNVRLQLQMHKIIWDSNERKR
jgi:7-carboxy-7-deazaguanine synthase